MILPSSGSHMLYALGMTEDLPRLIPLQPRGSMSVLEKDPTGLTAYTVGVLG